MPYYKILRNIIADTNYTQEEIAEKCTKAGNKITRSYINKLLNNKLPAPTENVSRAIAKACNIDERLLVLEGYLDKAPKEIQDFIISLKMTTSLYSLNFYENKIDYTSLNILKENLKKETLSDFVIQVIDNNKDIEMNNQNMLEMKIENKNVFLNFSSPFTLKMQDNSMSPLIKENDEVILELKNKYDNCDIIAFSEKNNDNIIIRQVIFSGKEIHAIPLNKKYKIDFYEKNKISILGKVKKIITEI